MKKVLLMIVMLFISLNVYAKGPTNFLLNLTVVDLSHTEDSEATFGAQFPGKRSGNCKLIIRSLWTHDLRPLLERFNIQPLFLASSIPDTSIPNAIIFTLKPGVYESGFTLSTKDGKSIAENVNAAVGPFDTVGIVLGTCNKLPPTEG